MRMRPAPMCERPLHVVSGPKVSVDDAPRTAGTVRGAMQDRVMLGARSIQWAPGPVAMLWDMDNVLTGRDDVAGLARLLGDLGGPEVRRIAAGHFVTWRAHGTTAGEMGFE